MLWQYTDAQVDRRSIDAVSDRDGETEPRTGDPLEFLVVGTDDRSQLTPEERVEHSTGRDLGPPRTDVMLLVQVRPGDEAASMVSIPRDLLVDHRNSRTKLNGVMARSGRDGLVDTIERLLGVHVDHYVEVSIPAFLTVVEAVGGVEVCLDEPLVDDHAGADLPAGCQELDAGDSLAFVRSREGSRGDFKRIERQQQFLHSLIEELTSARTAIDLPRLFRIADRVGGSLVTDEDLSLNDLRQLGDELRDLATDDVRAATVPAYPDGGGLALYEPGARRLFAALARGDQLPTVGRPEERSETRVRLWRGGPPERTAKVESLLFFLGFDVETTVSTPVDPVGVEVFAAPGHEEAATWVANVLGVTTRPLPSEADVGDAHVLVAVGTGT